MNLSLVRSLLVISTLTSCAKDSRPPTQPPLYLASVDDTQATDWETVPRVVRELTRTVFSQADIVRGFWFIYPYDRERGYRVWMQLNSREWIEIGSSGRTTRFLIEGRFRVKEEPGTLVLRLPNSDITKQAKPSVPFDVPPADVTLEVFIPDLGSNTKVGLFRVQGQEWQTLAILNFFK